MFKSTGPKTIAEYIEAIPEPRRTEIVTLHNMIQKAVPKLAPSMQGGIIGYGTYHYKYASGREGDCSVVGLASNKQYISVYVSASVEGGYCAERYKPEFPKASIGKSCIRFKRLADIDLKTLEKVIKECVRVIAKFATA